MFNYKIRPPFEPRGQGVGSESLRIVTEFANMAMADKGSILGDKGNMRPCFQWMGGGFSRISR